MSPRLLIFTGSGPVWICNDGVGTELMPKLQRPKDARSIFKRKSLVANVLQPMLIPHQHHVPQLSQDTFDATIIRWYMHIVEPYSATQLTYQTDKLPALSGLATMFRQRFGSRPDNRYFAGHWEGNSLLGSLSWTYSPVLEDRERMRQPWVSKLGIGSQYVAPTWSVCVSNGSLLWSVNLVLYLLS